MGCRNLLSRVQTKLESPFGNYCLQTLGLCFSAENTHTTTRECNLWRQGLLWDGVWLAVPYPGVCAGCARSCLCAARPVTIMPSKSWNAEHDWLDTDAFVAESVI